MEARLSRGTGWLALLYSCASVCRLTAVALVGAVVWRRDVDDGPFTFRPNPGVRRSAIPDATNSVLMHLHMLWITGRASYLVE